MNIKKVLIIFLSIVILIILAYLFSVIFLELNNIQNHITYNHISCKSLYVPTLPSSFEKEGKIYELGSNGIVNCDGLCGLFYDQEYEKVLTFNMAYKVIMDDYDDKFVISSNKSDILCVCCN